MNHRDLSVLEKQQIKRSLVGINRHLKKLRCEWLSKTHQLDVSLHGVRRALIRGDLSDLPSSKATLKLIASFEEELDFDLSLRDKLVFSFVKHAKKSAFNRSKRIAAENSLNEQEYMSDIENEVYFCICESMYHYEDESKELSTYFFTCIKNWLDRCHRYCYAKITGMSVEAIHDIIAYTTTQSNVFSREGHVTFSDLVESLEIPNERVLRAAELSVPFMRADRCIESDSEQTFIELVPDKRKSFEHLENIDVLESLRKVLSSEDQCLIDSIGMTVEERDVLNGGLERSFEWGWQSDFALKYVSSTGKKYTKARIGQIYKSAISKCRSLAKI